MKHRVIQQVIERAELAKDQSDFDYFFALLLYGEALLKTVVLCTIAALDEDKSRNRYRLEYTLARADGLGDWSRALEDALTGPASQFLPVAAHTIQGEIVRPVGPEDWQNKATSLLKTVLDKLGVESEPVPVKTDLRRWFRLFVTLRNKTRAHGATSATKASHVLPELTASINLVFENLSVFKLPWASISRNYSGKFRVYEIAGDGIVFDPLKKESHHSLKDGVYVYIDSFRHVPLIAAGADVRDFFFANGGMTAKRYELLSYCSDDKVNGDAAEYSLPPGALPSSETEGYGDLEPRGNCFSNAPEALEDYIPRPALETQLRNLLLDQRRPIITLVGRGGIGKTSLSLAVINRLYEESRCLVRESDIGINPIEDINGTLGCLEVVKNIQTWPNVVGSQLLLKKNSCIEPFLVTFRRIEN